MGWIKLYRKIQNSPIYKSLNSKQRDILINLLLMANHQENIVFFNGKDITVKAGQVLTSLKGIKEKCAKDVSIQNIRTCLLVLENGRFLTSKSTNRYRLITIENWGLYQGSDVNQQTNQQASNKQLTTNKNVKNEKKNNLFVETSNEFQLSKYLFELIRKNNPKAKEPNFQTWSKQFDLMIRVDKREVQEIKNLINWSQNDSFWYKNILSPQKLRKQYDQLIVKMYDDKTVKPNITQVQSTDIYKLDENGDFNF